MPPSLNMIQKDYSDDPAYIKTLPPKGFDYWEPQWELREEIVNGKKIKKIIKHPRQSVEAQTAQVMQPETKRMVDVFECNHCSYNCDTKQGILMHIRKKHKDASQ